MAFVLFLYMLIGLTQLPDKLGAGRIANAIVGAVINRPRRSDSYVFLLERRMFRAGRLRAVNNRPYGYRGRGRLIGNYGMIATGNHGNFDSLRGAPRPYGRNSANNNFPVC